MEQKKVLKFIEKNPNATKVTISEATGIKGLQLFNLLKKLKSEGSIVETESGNEKFYSMATIDESGSNDLNEEVTAGNGRDNSKYKFNGELYGKGPLVHAIVTQYVVDNPSTTYKKLKEVFPDDLLKRFGIFQDEETAKKIAPKGNRYFTKEEKVIKLKDKKIVVCNQFTLANIQPFLKVAKMIGYKIR